MSYRETVDYILSLQRFGIKLGLGKMQQMAELFGHPERSFRNIHIAGTNGKGSVAAICASLLRASGYRVGLYTSPHLVSFTERIQVDGEPIPECDVVSTAETIRFRLAQASDIAPPTFFEFTTLLALLYFRQRNVDWAVIETGMGGRLDATCIVDPAITVLTRIDLDHQQFLGATLEAIAREKAGIMKEGVSVVSAAQKDEAARVLADAAQMRGCSILTYGRDFSADVEESTLDGVVMNYKSSTETIARIEVPLAGRHQAENTAVAIASFRQLFPEIQSDRVLNSSMRSSISQDTMRLGIAQVRWPGRLEIVCRDPLTIVDGAHNPAGAQALSAFLREHAAGYQIALVLGILADKDIAGIMHPLLAHAAELFIAPPASGRAASTAVLAEIALHAGLQPHHYLTIGDAFHAARSWSDAQKRYGLNPMIVITGSLYTVGEVHALLGASAVLGSLREHR
jgi:dihydrofolate synthase/folylpolyglutamate synthase